MVLFDTSHIKSKSIIDGDKFEFIRGNIIYLTTDDLIDQINRGNSFRDLILLTHNSDYPITPQLISKVQKLGFPKHWYAQNVLMKYNKITPIPIGLERVRWFPEQHKRDIILEYMNKDIKPNNLCLANFSINNNIGQRKSCLNAGKSFSTVLVESSVIQNSYTDYLRGILEHYFVLCPEGNGIDTHRLWETLYLGRIPVVINNPTIESLKGLPMLVLPSWDQLNENILMSFLDGYEKTNYSIEKLDFNYWEKLIIEATLC
jgi:hypothetical protein